MKIDKKNHSAFKENDSLKDKRLQELFDGISKQRMLNVSLQPQVVPLEIINNPETISHPQLNQQTTPISINCNGIMVSIDNCADPGIISAVVRALRADL